MTNRTPLTDAERERIHTMHAEGHTLGEVTAALGRSKSTVSTYARRHGLQWSTAKTEAATATRQASNRDKRARLETRFLDEAAKLLDQLHKPHTVFSFGGRDNTYAEHQLEEPDVQSKRSLIQAAGTAVDRALKLADADKAGAGADAGKSLIGSMFVALRTIPLEDGDTVSEEG